jgi:hypothetical protein
MKRYLCGLAALALIVIAAPVWAADASGTWKGDVKLPNGQVLPFVAHLKQQKSVITGKLDGINGAPDVEIIDGKVTGDTITFSGVRKINGADVKFNYNGKLAGDSLDIKIVRADGSGAPLETLTKRVSE